MCAHRICSREANVGPDNGVISSPGCKRPEPSTCGVQ